MENKKIIFFAPHPDDETLGCGGTILNFKKKKYKIYWIIISKMHSPKWSQKQIDKRKIEILKVNKKYKFDKVFELGFKSSSLDLYPMDQLVSSISNIVDKLKPGIIFLNSSQDVHTDHQISYNAIISATKSFRKKFIDNNLDKSAFNPNLFIDISKTFKLKSEIFKIYKSEIMHSNFPRSINILKSLNSLRGSRIGVKYAEAFKIIFEKN